MKNIIRKTIWALSIYVSWHTLNCIVVSFACKFIYSIQFWGETHTRRIFHQQYSICGWTKQASTFRCWIKLKNRCLLFFILPKRLSFTYNMVGIWMVTSRWNIQKISFNCFPIFTFSYQIPEAEVAVATSQTELCSCMELTHSKKKKKKRQQYNRLHCLLSVTTATSDCRLPINLLILLCLQVLLLYVYLGEHCSLNSFHLNDFHIIWNECVVNQTKERLNDNNETNDERISLDWNWFQYLNLWLWTVDFKYDSSRFWR